MLADGRQKFSKSDQSPMHNTTSAVLEMCFGLLSPTEDGIDDDKPTYED
jgi:hypothetical protein